jgi:hemerythrin-like metal-binding protein
MNKDQEILAISRLAFELTKVGNTGADLDELLARLCTVLQQIPSLRVLPQGSILLLNPRRRLVQVAQYGLPPVWTHPVQQGHAVDHDRDHAEHAYLSTPATHLPALDIEGVAKDAPCFVLPLTDEGRLLGHALLFIAPDWHPDAVDFEFMSDLARTISVLVARVFVHETLRVREIELEDARTDAIRRLGAASEYRDNETGMHVMRMTHYATVIAKAMGLSLEEREVLSITAPMHDVGKIGIADAILLKPGRLTEDEYDVMKTHTEIGERLLKGEDALIRAARDIAAYHHERWDGTGYPYGLAGEAIPVLARICAIADVFDALTSSRPYKTPWTVAAAVEWIQRQSGSHFDPVVVEAFEQAMPEILRIRELYRDDIIDPNQTLNLPEMVFRKSGWVQWSDDLSVGIDVIDEHHRYLFDLTNDLFEVVSRKLGSREVARVLKALDQYARIHFRAEERMMAHHGYAGLDRQHHQHHRFEEKLREFQEELHDTPLTAQFDVLIYLRGWLVQHIVHEDAQLQALVSGQAA